MRGVIGILNLGRAPVPCAVLERMTDSPAVIDPTPTARQLMASDDGRYVLAYNGMVAFPLCDNRERTLLPVRGRFARKPLSYARLENILIFQKFFYRPPALSARHLVVAVYRGRVPGVFVAIRHGVSMRRRS